MVRWRDGDASTAPDGTVDDTLYYCTDANFNVTALVNTSGSAVERYVYTPYGERTIYNAAWSSTVTWANSYQNVLGFTGHKHDAETGLVYGNRRYYHPTLGRWVTRDLEYFDGLNLYEYGASRATITLDPVGLATYSIEEVIQLTASRSGEAMFMLRELKRRNVTLEVRSIFLSDFDGEDDYVRIDCDADTSWEASLWLEDGIREWAYNNRDGAHREIVRNYARFLANRGAPAGYVLSQTFTFAYRYSWYMVYDTKGYSKAERLEHYDLSGIYGWAFTGVDDGLLLPFGFTPEVRVNNNADINVYYHSYRGQTYRPDETQTHHFAGFFLFGHDVGGVAAAGRVCRFRGDTPQNDPGDYLLGLIAAKLGEQFRNNPEAFRGSHIRHALYMDPRVYFGADRDVREAMWYADLTAMNRGRTRTMRRRRKTEPQRCIIRRTQAARRWD